MLPSNTAQTRKETYGLPFLNKQDRESLPEIWRSWIQGFLPFDMEKRKIRFPMGGGGNIYEKARSAAGTLPGYAWGMFETLFKINKAEKKTAEQQTT